MEILIGFGGVVLGAILTQARESWARHRSKKQRASYLAVRIVPVLENFFYNCLSVVEDRKYKDEQGYLRPTIPCPSINFDSIDVDWQALPFGLMYDIITFPLLVDEANNIIDSVAENIAIPPDYAEYFEELEIQYSELGLNAINLAATLRHRYKFPKNDEDLAYGVMNLRNCRAKIKKIRENQ